jgi:hypothetical protein
MDEIKTEVGGMDLKMRKGRNTPAAGSGETDGGSMQVFSSEHFCFLL